MLKFALYGCGRIAQKHAELLGTGKIPNALLASVCDIVEEKAKQFSEKYKVPFFTDPDDMMQTVNPDVIVILTESGNHANHTVELAKYGTHLIVEKPMALKPEDADRMIKACNDNNCRLFVVKQNRYNLPVQQLRKALDDGRFGKLFMGTVRVRWCREQHYYDQAEWRGTRAFDGGVLSNQAIHFIDLLQWIMGDVESVTAKGMTAAVNIETEDTAVVLLKFKNGALGVIEATTAVRPKDLEGSVSILGEKGSVEIGGIALNQIIQWQFIDQKEDLEFMKQTYSIDPPDVYGFGHEAYYNDLVNSLLNNIPFPISGQEGKKSMQIVSAIYESIEKNKEVFLS
jgi:UDP-N-acetyl-2-amino-2-deoxyglucuronate dehydrogenase